MNRREFLVTSAAVAAAGAVSLRGQSADADRQAKLARISILTLNFDSVLKTPEQPNRPLDIMDIPDMFADRYGVHYVELFCRQLPSTEPGYMQAFLARVKKAKSKINQISLGGLQIVSMSSPSPQVRQETIDLTKRWIDHAIELECSRVMVNQGTLAPDVLQEAIATLKVMSDYGKSKKVMVTLEHRGSAAGAGDLVDTITAAGAYANLDIGNFGADDALRHREIRRMMPLTSGSTHMKMSPNWSLPDSMKIIREEFKYKGIWALEGSGQDPYATTQAMLDAILPLM